MSNNRSSLAPRARIFHTLPRGAWYGVPALAGQPRFRPESRNDNVSSRWQGPTPCRLKPGLHTLRKSSLRRYPTHPERVGTVACPTTFRAIGWSAVPAANGAGFAGDLRVGHVGDLAVLQARAAIPRRAGAAQPAPRAILAKPSRK